MCTTLKSPTPHIVVAAIANIELMVNEKHVELLNVYILNDILQGPPGMQGVPGNRGDKVGHQLYISVKILWREG